MSNLKDLITGVISVAYIKLGCVLWILRVRAIELTSLVVSKNISGLKTGTSNNRTVQSDDVGDVITSEGVVLHLSESCSNPDISGGVRAEIDADLGVVVHKGCNLTLVIRESIELQPKRFRVVQWLAFIKGTLVVNTAVRHIVEVYKLMNVRAFNFLYLLWT